MTSLTASASDDRDLSDVETSRLIAELRRRSEALVIAYFDHKTPTVPQQAMHGPFASCDNLARGLQLAVEHHRFLRAQT